ncbi:hypothetical protein ACP4OV_010578 [Aristida adscensionis]
MASMVPATKCACDEPLSQACSHFATPWPLRPTCYLPSLSTPKCNCAKHFARTTSISMAKEEPLALSPSPGAKRKGPGATDAPAERARRRDMSRLYADLGALLPDLPPRASRTRILEEAIAYVGALRATAAELEAHRALRASGGAVEVLAPVGASCFSVRMPAAPRPRSLARVLEVFHRHGAAVLAATVASDGGEAAVTVTTTPVAPAALERIKEDIVRSMA